MQVYKLNLQDKNMIVYEGKQEWRYGCEKTGEQFLV